jgi:hypothetical protein
VHAGGECGDEKLALRRGVVAGENVGGVMPGGKPLVQSLWLAGKREAVLLVEFEEREAEDVEVGPGVERTGARAGR